VLLAIVSEMTGVVGVQIGASRRYDGPMGKSDRAFLVGAAAVLLALAPSFGWPGADIVSWAFLAASALLCLTIFNRARRALAERA
jgi:CDP-diacylglycerol--glycerol-3-phosphate 3-phosphatidyltransferase